MYCICIIQELNIYHSNLHTHEGYVWYEQPTLIYLTDRPNKKSNYSDQPTKS